MHVARIHRNFLVAISASHEATEVDMKSDESLKFKGVDRLDDHQLLVEFSDGTICTFTARQLALLNPERGSAARLDEASE